MFGIINLDEMYSYNPDAVIANNVSFTEPNFSEAITNLIYSDNKTDDIGFVAECSCGFLKGNYHIGSTCPQCHQLVSTKFVDNLRHKVWIGTPEGIQSFMHPVVYMVLANWLKKNPDNYLDVMLNVNAKIPEELEGVITGQGFNYVRENFDYLMDYFLNVHYKTRTKKQVNYIKWFLNEYRDRIWCTKLPVLSNELHPITKQGRSLKYADNSSKDILSAIIDLATIQFSIKTTVTNPIKLEQVTFTAYASYIEYLTKIIKSKLASKHGLLRKHMFGTRLHGTFRSVIVPIVGEHQADELHIPWNVAVNTYKLMIMNLLTNRYNYSMVDALDKVMKALLNYDPDIDDIFRILIKEVAYTDPVTKRIVPLIGLPVLLQRNPSLVHQSIQLVFVTKIKTEIADHSIGMSSAIVRGPNADRLS
jgi:hypothetical protein